MNIDAHYANYFEVASLKEINNSDKRTALKEVAKQLESVFLQMVLKSMNDCNAVMQSDLFERDSEKFYQDMLDQQLALSLSKSGGIGLAEIIVRQLEGRNDSSAMEEVKVMPKRVAAAPLANAELSVPTLKSEPEIENKVPTTYVESIWPHAENAGKSIGIDPQVLVAQSILETGWGKHIVANNLFGMKSHNDSGILAQTTEYLQNAKVKVQATFKSYQSYADSFYDYIKLISSKRYAQALNAKTPRDYLQGLKDAGYATDPNYVDKVMAIYEKLVTSTIL